MLEDSIEQKTNEKLRQLSQAVGSIKEGATAIRKHMVNEEGLVVEIGSGFEKNQTIMSKTVEKIDRIIGTASSNIYCYIIMFVFIVLALLFKLSW